MPELHELSFSVQLLANLVVSTVCVSHRERGIVDERSSSDGIEPASVLAPLRI